jgi:hypothetical protein
MISRTDLLAFKRDLVEQLEIVDAMLDGLDRLARMNQSEPFTISAASPAPVSSIVQHAQAVGSPSKQQRVRGVLTAVREVVQELQGPFDKNDIMAKLKEKHPKLAAKVSSANLRNTLRLLGKKGDIKVEVDATSVTCAKYVSKRVAA